VRLLELRLGVALFERHANRLALTAAGRAYQAGLTPLLDEIAALTDRVTALGSDGGAGSGRRTMLVTVGAGPSFATRWLIPRLAELRRREPGLEVRITTGGAAAPFDGEWTCGIRLGEGDFPGLVATPLFAADLLPVCAPALAARLGAAGPGALAGETLLRVAHASEDWPRWLAAAGAAGVRASGPVFDFYGQALQAAADGVGVAMGIRPYVDDDLATGRLAAPYALTLSKGKGWFLVHRAAREAEPGFAAFRRWIVEAARSLGR
jgi:LysR family glycine cleavage system transcriptional activator